MAKEPWISNQTAILLGSVVIALGLFLGLRSRDAAPPPLPPPATQPPAAQTTAAQTTAPPPAAPPAAPSIDRSEIVKQAAAALGSERKKLGEKCFAPSLAKQPEPKTVKLNFNFTFDASGKQIARGVSEVREFARPDVTSCVLDALPAISVPAPGQTVFVEVPFELP